MPISEDPLPAKDLATFGSGKYPAASINYSVPLPGTYSIPRFLPLKFSQDWFTDAAKKAGTSLKDLGVVKSGEGDPVQIDPDRLRLWYERLIPLTSRPAPRLVDLSPSPTPSPSTGDASVTGPPTPPAAGAVSGSPFIRTLNVPGIEFERVRRARFLDELAERQTEFAPGSGGAAAPVFEIPAPGLGQSIRIVPAPLKLDSTPTIALVETFQLSSFLGDYGLGRTLQTFSLLPGERTMITVETWRSTSATREDSSSVFDSSDVAAQTRFTSELSTQSGSASTDQGTWVSSLATTGGGGFSFFGLFGGNFQAQTYDAATSQYSREQFSTTLSQSASEHAAQVNNSRQQAVQSVSAAAAQTGTSETTIREIANTNLRRVLNFVFRELNQTYETITSLRDVRVAFYNGNPGSARIVPLAQLREFLEDLVVAEHRDEVARTLLTAITECVDEDGTPQTMLQVGHRKGGVFDWKDATLDDQGKLDFPDGPLERKYAWRIKPGALAQEGAKHPVPGVVIDRPPPIILRTDNVVVEALLGQADALDPYASALQALDLQSRKADITRRKVETSRTKAALELIAKMPADKVVDAWEAILGEKPEIEVVPVAAVNSRTPE